MKMRTFGLAIAALISLVAFCAFAGVKGGAIYQFCSRANCADGLYPSATLIADSAGNLYGTTEMGGAYNGGTVFELTRSGSGWQERVLYSFCAATNCTDGAEPYDSVAFDSHGNIFGVTRWGGSPSCNVEGVPGCGVVFELTPEPAGTLWKEKVLYTFCSQAGCADGADPVAGLIFDSAGNLFGSTAVGGNSGGYCASEGCGVVFELSPQGGGWLYNVVHAFAASGDEGSYPFAPLVADGEGNFYGTTLFGGARTDGVVFELQPSGRGWAESVLYNFCSLSNCADGGLSYAPILFGRDGNMYGTASGGGTLGNGAVFELTPSAGGWAEQVLYSFRGGSTDGSGPSSGVVFDAHGNLYGTAVYGEGGFCGNCGAVYKLIPSGAGWTEKNINVYEVAAPGSVPNAGLLLLGGRLYGATLVGTTFDPGGTIFEIAP